MARARRRAHYGPCMQYPHRARPFARSLPGFGGPGSRVGCRAWVACWMPGLDRVLGSRAWTGSAGPLRLDCMVSQDVRVRSGIAIPPAPLDRGELELALRPFGESRMLPRAAYTDPAVFGWEQRHFFGGGWMCVARSDQLPQP